MLISEDIITELQHLIQRSQFINPVHLPTLTESILAKDFDFGEYLAIQLGKVLKAQFDIHFVTLLCSIPVLTTCFYFVGSNDGSSTVVDLETSNMSEDAYYISNAIMAAIFVLSVTMVFFIEYELAQIKK